MVHKYPQNIWASEISKIILNKTSELNSECIVFDAPCGNGIIANLVSKKIKNKTFVLLDSDTELLKSQYTNDNSRKFQVLNDDIFKYKPEGSNNIWLLVNSLYCLPDIDKLLDFNQSAFKYIIGVFPDIDKINFKVFRKYNPSFKNPSLMNIQETLKFFESHGFKTGQIIKTTSVPFHLMNLLLDKLYIKPSFKNLVYILLDKIFFFLPKQYNIVLFVKYE